MKSNSSQQSHHWTWIGHWNKIGWHWDRTVTSRQRRRHQPSTDAWWRLRRRPPTWAAARTKRRAAKCPAFSRKTPSTVVGANCPRWASPVSSPRADRPSSSSGRVSSSSCSRRRRRRPMEQPTTPRRPPSASLVPQPPPFPPFRPLIRRRIAICAPACDAFYRLFQTPTAIRVSLSTPVNHPPARGSPTKRRFVAF